MAHLLAADVGGTKVLLRVFDSQTHEVLAEKRYLSANFASLSFLIQSFQAEFSLNNIQIACLGLPGPVSGRRAKLTNLPWLVDADVLSSDCGIPVVEVINDFSAAARGINELSPDDLICLQTGDFDEKGNRLIVGAGSGLGVAPIVNFKGEFTPQASEGGHMDFAPLNASQIELLTWLQKKWTHVSYERILSGEGIETLYSFFNAKTHGHSHFNIGLFTSAEQVHQLAVNGDTIAQRALDTFVEVYGAYIGNAALIWEARAGIYIAGGIAPKISDWMQKPNFLNAFRDKGRMKHWVETMPIYLITNEQLGLLGAVHLAKSLYQSSLNARTNSPD